jgi:hypothetical protein
LIPVSSGANADATANPGGAKGMQPFVTAFDRREYFIPFPLDIGAIGMELMAQTGSRKNFLTFSNIAGNR